MIKKINLLLVNRKIMFLLIAVLISLSIWEYHRYTKLHSAIYLNLQGTYVLDLGSSIISRSFDVVPLGGSIIIEGDEIRLPLFACKQSSVSNVNTYKDIEGIQKERNGTVKTISSASDSIFIDAKFHLLHGKYKVLFKTDSVGDIVPITKEYLYLDNDSTHLCLVRVK